MTAIARAAHLFIAQGASHRLAKQLAVVAVAASGLRSVAARQRAARSIAAQLRAARRGRS